MAKTEKTPAEKTPRKARTPKDATLAKQLSRHLEAAAVIYTNLTGRGVTITLDKSVDIPAIISIKKIVPETVEELV